MGDKLNVIHRDAVERLIADIDGRLDGSPLAVMVDVDGTLAPIAPTPATAGVPAQTRDVVRRLVGLPNVVVALISGRSAADAWRVAGVEGTWVIGNHGIELRTPAGDLSAKSEVREFEPVIERATHTLRALEQTVRGTLIENKRWTLSVHYRLVSAGESAQVAARAREVGEALGLRVTQGKKIIELRPPILVNKGTASVEFAQNHGALREGSSAMYAGDDRTDEDAFRDLRAGSPRAVTIRIVGSDEDGVADTSAEFSLESTEDLRRALDWLAARRASTGAASATAR